MRVLVTWGSNRGGIAQALPSARPRPAIPPPGRPLARLVLHAVCGWATCAALMAFLLRLTTPGTALVRHTIAAPLVFIGVARRYFGRPARASPSPPRSPSPRSSRSST
jgi:hypothetical protein